MLVEDTPLVVSLERLREHLSARGRHAEAVEPAREVAELTGASPMRVRTGTPLRGRRR
jgi:cobalamin biosynthesis protein CbiG